MRKWILPVVAAMLLLVQVASRAQEQRLIRLKFNKGDVYHYAIEMSGVGEMTMKTSGTADMESFDLPMDLSLYSEIEVQVIDVDDARRAEMDIYLNRFRMNTGPGFMFDSSDDEEDLPPFLQVLFDEPVIIEMGDDGMIHDVSFPQTEAQVDEAMKALFPSHMDLAAILKQSMFRLPESPVAPGDTWSQSVALPVPGSDAGEVSVTYDFVLRDYETVKGLECAVIEMTVSEEVSRQVGSVELSGFSGPGERVTMHFDRLGLDFSATLYFAWQAGVFVGAEGFLAQDVRGTMTASVEDEVIGLGMDFEADISVELQ